MYDYFCKIAKLYVNIIQGAKNLVRFEVHYLFFNQNVHRKEIFEWIEQIAVSLFLYTYASQYA